MRTQENNIDIRVLGLEASGKKKRKSKKGTKKTKGFSKETQTGGKRGKQKKEKKINGKNSRKRGKLGRKGCKEKIRWHRGGITEINVKGGSGRRRKIARAVGNFKKGPLRRNI